MKKLNEIMQPIKLNNKVGTDTIKQIQKDVNTKIFKYYNGYVNNLIKSKLLTIIAEKGKELSDSKVNSAASAKKKELLEELRKRYKILKDYQPDLHQYNYCAQMSQNYMLSKYLHLKGNNEINTSTEIVAMLDLIQESINEWEAYIPKPNLVKAKEELLQQLINLYK